MSVGPSTQLALHSVAGGSATGIGWGTLSNYFAGAWAPACRAAVALLEQALAAERREAAEKPCACALQPLLEAEIAKAAVTAIQKKEEEVLEPPGWLVEVVLELSRRWRGLLEACAAGAVFVAVALQVVRA